MVIVTVNNYYYFSIVDLIMILLHNIIITDTVIKSDEILIVATRVNSLHVAWWTRNASLVERYSICALPSKPTCKIEQSVERLLSIPRV